MRETMGVRKPWFPFYVYDFWQDESVLAMTFEQVGLYLRLLSLQWIEGSIPADGDRVSRIVGLSSDALATLWPALAPCFPPVENDPTRLANPRLVGIVDQQTEVHRKVVEAGRLGGAATRRRFSTAPATHQHRSSDASTPIQQPEPDPDSKQDPPVGPPEGAGGGDTEPTGKRKRKKPTTPPPDSFEPTVGDMRWFRGKFGEVPRLDIRHQTEMWINHHRAKGNQFVDWNAAWKTWMVNWRSDFGRKTPTPVGRPPPPRKNPNLVREDD